MNGSVHTPESRHTETQAKIIRSNLGVDITKMKTPPNFGECRTLVMDLSDDNCDIEASRKNLIERGAVDVRVDPKEKQYDELHEKANAAGLAAMETVENDDSVGLGVASKVWVTPANHGFAQRAKKHGYYVAEKGEKGGYIPVNFASLAKSAAYAEAYCNVLVEAKVPAGLTMIVNDDEKTETSENKETVAA